MDQAVAGDVVYCDPPYADQADKRSFTGYGKEGFSWDDQTRLADKARELAERGIRVVISNHDTSSTRELYFGAQLHFLDVRRSIAAQADSRGTAHELVAVFGLDCTPAFHSASTRTRSRVPTSCAVTAAPSSPTTWGVAARVRLTSLRVAD